MRVQSQLSPAGETWVRRTRGLLDALAIAFLVVFVLLWAFPEGPPGLLLAFNFVAWIVWAAFVVDYFVRLRCSTPKKVFVRTHKIDLLMVLVPMLRLLRVLLILRKALSSVSTEKIAGSIVTVIVIVVAVGAFIVWRVEYDAPGATITTYRDAIWWAIVTSTTVGYGDYTPITPTGRVVAVIIMIVGVALIGTVSATVAAYFVNRRAVASNATDSDTISSTPDELIARLDALAAQQAAMAEQQTAIAAQQAELRELLDRLASR